jgi:hypothetical protein
MQFRCCQYSHALLCCPDCSKPSRRNTSLAFCVAVSSVWLLEHQFPVREQSGFKHCQSQFFWINVCICENLLTVDSAHQTAGVTKYSHLLTCSADVHHSRNCLCTKDTMMCHTGVVCSPDGPQMQHQIARAVHKKGIPMQFHFLFREGIDWYVTTNVVMKL